jgi:hypothetical protein
MNDKILTMALMLTFIMIGINAFLFMASSNLYDEQGNQLSIYYGLDSGGFGQQIQTDAENIDIDTGVSISSSAPSTIQGITAVTREDNPVGLSYGQDLQKLGIGVQLVMLKFSDLFPMLSPIVNAIVFFAFAVQGFALAYLGSVLIRGILGRIQ